VGRRPSRRCARQTTENTVNEIRLEALAGLPCGQMIRIDLGDTAVCIAHVDDGGYFALDDTCSHGQYALSDGALEGREVECFMHGSLFDVRTGEPLTAPATLPVRTYEVKVDGEDLVLSIPEV